MTFGLTLSLIHLLSLESPLFSIIALALCLLENKKGSGESLSVFLICVLIMIAFFLLLIGCGKWIMKDPLVTKLKTLKVKFKALNRKEFWNISKRAKKARDDFLGSRMRTFC